MNDLYIYDICTVAASTVVSGGLAIAWAKSRSPYRFVLSMAAVWVFISMLPLWAHSWDLATFPADSRHFVATMMWSAPFVIATVVGLVWLVAAGARRIVILLVSFVASMVAVPISVLSALYAACSL